MAEVVRHDHVDHADSSSGFGFLLGAVLVVALLALLFFWGLPALRGVGGNAAPVEGGTGVNINVPNPNMSAPQGQ